MAAAVSAKQDHVLIIGAGKQNSLPLFANADPRPGITGVILAQALKNVHESCCFTKPLAYLPCFVTQPILYLRERHIAQRPQ